LGKVSVILPNELEEELRRRAAEVYGYKRGFITKAIIEAIVNWLERRREKE